MRHNSAVSGPHVVRSTAKVPRHGLDQIRYAAAFIHPAVRKVWLDDGAWYVETSAPVDQATVDGGLNVLVKRFGGARIADAEASFSVAAPASADSATHRARAEAATSAFREIAPGIVTLRPPLSAMRRFLDWAILRQFARHFGASEEVYPNVIPLATLARTNHLTSFPEHLHFVTHLTEDLTTIDAFSERMSAAPEMLAPDPEILAPISLIQNPATCYHCYALRSGTVLPADDVVTAVTTCHRYEAANHAEPGRLMEFTMREVIFVGRPDFIREARETSLRLVRAWVESWGIIGDLVPANDPFFTNEYRTKATHQRILAMKYEYRAALPHDGRSLAVISSNQHAATFGTSFDIRIDDGPANTGCLAFGLERLLLALVCQHGTEPAAWPEGMRTDYDAWRAADPLSV